MHVCPEEGDVGGARERRLSGQALVEDATERVEIRPRFDVVARYLLGRDVLERADDVPWGGNAAERARALGQAEVREVAMLLAAGYCDEDVRGLDVPVHETLLVSRVQSLRDLLEQADRTARIERAAVARQLREVGPFDVAHGEEESAVLVSRLEDRNDVRVVERSGDPRLAQEALPEAAVLGELGRNDLQSDLAT